MSQEINNPIIEKKRRSFGGNFSAVIAGKNVPQGQYEKKHLKAYLKGKKWFGTYPHGMGAKPEVHRVIEIYS